MRVVPHTATWHCWARPQLTALGKQSSSDCVCESTVIFTISDSDLVVIILVPLYHVLVLTLIHAMLVVIPDKVYWLNKDYYDQSLLHSSLLG